MSKANILAYLGENGKRKEHLKQLAYAVGAFGQRPEHKQQHGSVSVLLQNLADAYAANPTLTAELVSIIRMLMTAELNESDTEFIVKQLDDPKALIAALGIVPEWRP